MKQFINTISTYIAFLFISLFLASSASAEEKPLVFGIFPYLTPRQMVDQFAPLKEHIVRELGLPVNLSTAQDYKNFIERTSAGEYDFIFDAPHLARLAQKRDGYHPLAMTGYKIVILAVTRKDSTIQTLADLRGHKISIGARMSMTHQIIAEALRKNGLVLGKDVQYLDTASFTNVLQSVIRGDAAAGATGTLFWDAAVAEEKRELREIYRQKDPVPGFIVMAHPRIGEGMMHKLQKALYSFKDTPEGKAYFQKTNQIDFRPVDEATMRSLESYTRMLVQPSEP
jgi:phosphonate transport system substrate-binding protein